MPRIYVWNLFSAARRKIYKVGMAAQWYEEVLQPLTEQVTFHDLLLVFFYSDYIFFISACPAPASVILKNIPGNYHYTEVMRLVL